ncbi:MAG: phosphatase PAP2 family protein [Actinomycetota bacterium]|nr:phosphatase PAP2 family protein [Actinomycetota bacterium]
MSTTAEAPTFVAASTRLRLSDLVPYDEFRVARLALMFEFLFIYLWWLRIMGLPVDRISVAISVGIFLVCAFIGRSWRTWGVLLLDCLAYSVMWWTYEATRGAADDGIGVLGLFRIKFPRQVDSMRDIDRVMFFGNDPNVVLQDHFWEPSVRWYDVVASTTYMTHFVLPIITMAVLWVVSRRQWVRFMKRFATLLGVACVLFVLLPTVPPWMAAEQYDLFGRLHRDAGRGFRHLGFKGFVNDYHIALSNGNAVAAMPSLHASFAFVVPLFFFEWIRRRWVKAALLLFPVTMLASLVYLGEHWVIDGLVGWGITAGAFWFWNRMEQRTRSVRSLRAREGFPMAAALRQPLDDRLPAEQFPSDQFSSDQFTTASQ